MLKVTCGIQLLGSKLLVMSFIRCLAFHISAALLTCLPSAATNLVTGNGFGFAVVSSQTEMVTRFYAHPYSCVRPDHLNPLSEGVETANFIKSLGWNDPAAHGPSAEYEEDSQVIQVHSSAGDGFSSCPLAFSRAPSFSAGSLDLRQRRAAGSKRANLACQGTLSYAANLVEKKRATMCLFELANVPLCRAGEGASHNRNVATQ